MLTLFLLITVFTVFAIPAAGQDEVPVPEVLTLPDQIAEGRDVTITVSNMPPADQAENRATWEAQAARFMELYPNVTIEGLELEYNPAAYVALAAGGQLPTLFMTYFTEPSKFIPQDVVADITPYIEAAGIEGVFNPNVLEITSADGAIYGIPLNAYALGLAYNKDLLAAAGIDAPPATWEELVEDAVALTDADAGRAGLHLLTMAARDRLALTNIAYGFGATPADIIATNADGTYSAAYGASEATVAALDYVHALRWEHDVLPGATLDWGSLSEALMSDGVAMAIYAGDQFNFVYFNFPDADLNKFGFAPAPAGPNGSVSLIGGNRTWSLRMRQRISRKQQHTSNCGVNSIPLK